MAESPKKPIVKLDDMVSIVPKVGKDGQKPGERISLTVHPDKKHAAGAPTKVVMTTVEQAEHQQLLRKQLIEAARTAIAAHEMHVKEFGRPLLPKRIYDGLVKVYAKALEEQGSRGK
jgi:hypothetical protein